MYNSKYEGVPGGVKITYVYKDRERISEILAPGSQWQEAVQDLIDNLNMPVSAIKVYIDGELVSEEVFEVSKMRGSA